MWCPRCQKKYDDDFTTCLICGGELEEYTPILALDDRDVLDLGEASIPSSEMNEEAPPEEVMPELLVSVAGEEEARRLANLLESLKIPCLCRKAEQGLPAAEEWEDADGEFEESDEDFDDEFDEEEAFLPADEEIYDLLVPQMLVRKALRVLHEDEALQAEREAAAQKRAEVPASDASENDSDLTEAEEKPKKKFFGLFGKK